tara:strand:- start:2950 stop:3135 length:186 start_codon:yes stop_codon:yes gene_type:complete
VELTGLIAFQNLSSKFNSALDVPPQGFCRLPDGDISGNDLFLAQAIINITDKYRGLAQLKG